MRPKVGVGVLILRDGKVLLGKRKNAHGEGDWCPPGGHLEFNEEVEDCARREVFEESGLEITNIRRGPYTNDFFESEGKHYITLCVIADYAKGTASCKEPDKCEKWEWFSWDNLPEPLFLPLKNQITQGFNPFKF